MLPLGGPQAPLTAADFLFFKPGRVTVGEELVAEAVALLDAHAGLVVAALGPVNGPCTLRRVDGFTLRFAFGVPDGNGSLGGTGWVKCDLLSPAFLLKADFLTLRRSVLSNLL